MFLNYFKLNYIKATFNQKKKIFILNYLKLISLRLNYLKLISLR